MFERDSRYHDLETAHHARADGPPIAYKRRRFLPRPSAAAGEPLARARAGERMDLLTHRTLGAPTDFWRIADANPLLDTAHPDRPPLARWRIPTDPVF